MYILKDDNIWAFHAIYTMNEPKKKIKNGQNWLFLGFFGFLRSKNNFGDKKYEEHVYVRCMGSR